MQPTTAGQPAVASDGAGPSRPAAHEQEIESLRIRLEEAQAREQALEARAKELEAAVAKAEAETKEALAKAESLEAELKALKEQQAAAPAPASETNGEVKPEASPAVVEAAA